MILHQKKDATPKCRIAITGDFLPASGLQLPAGRNWTDIGSDLASYFSNVDAAILNLECPLGLGTGKPRLKLGMGDTFSASPDVLEFPAALGIKIIGLANNHLFDYGQDGATETRQRILQQNMVPIGIGKTLSDLPDVYVANTSTGLRIGFWAAARHLVDLASRTTPGIEPATRKRAEAAFRELRSRGASCTIAFLHAGLEGTNRPDPDDVALIDDLARIGFDVVTACHSHRISGYKCVPRHRARPAYCFYGLGSITSGVLYSDLEREGLIVVVGLDGSGGVVEVGVQPVYLEGTGFGKVPGADGARIILDRFLRISEEIAQGTYRPKFYRDVRVDLFRRQLRDFQVAIQNGGIRGLASKLARIRVRHLNRVFHHGLG